MAFFYSLSVSGACLLCNDKFNFVSSDEENEGVITSFKMFLRYLGVNLFEQFPTGVNLCKGCSFRLNGFWQLYQEFENLRLCLDDFVRSFYDRMKLISENSFNLAVKVEGYQDITKLRDVIMTKCITKLQSVPVIKLEKGIVLPQNDKMLVEIPSSPVLESIRVNIKTEVNNDIEDAHEDPDYINHDDVSSSDSELPMPTRRLRIITFKKHRRGNRLVNKKKSNFRKCKCNLCDLVLFDATSLKRHKVSKHLMEFHASKIPPGVTEPELRRATEMILKKKKVDPLMKMGCQFCPESYTTIRQLSLHIQVNHFDEILLALENPESAALQEIQTSDEINPWAQFSKIKNLTYYLKSNGKPFQCSICEKGLKNLKNFRLHLKLSHTLIYFQDKLPPGTTQEELDTSIGSLLGKAKTLPGGGGSCPVCFKEFKRMDYLNQHILFLHETNIIQQLGKFSPDDVKKRIRKPWKGILKSEKTKKKKRTTKVFKCTTCHKSIQTYKSFVIHKRHHQLTSKSNPSRTCTICNKVLCRHVELLKHQVSKHLMVFHATKIPPGVTEPELQEATQILMKKKKVYPSKGTGCPYCSRFYQTHNYFKAHIQMHHFDKVLLALKNPDHASLQQVDIQHQHQPLLKSQFEAEAKFRKIKHLTHNPHSSENPFQCSICKKAFTYLKNFRSHFKLSHFFIHFQDKLPPGTSQKELDTCIKNLLGEAKAIPGGGGSCHLCLKEFKLRKKLKPHYLTHVNEIGKQLGKLKNSSDFIKESSKIPPDAAVSYKNVKHLTYNSFNERSFECSICNESFKLLKSFETHLAVSHTLIYFEDKLPPGTSLKELDNFIDALVLEGKLKLKEEWTKWRCPLCSKLATSRNDLKSHILTSHVDKIVQSFGKISAAEVVKEVQMEPGKVDKPTNSKIAQFKFKCWTCGDKSDSQLNLTLHRELNHPGVPWECKFCQKSFRRSQKLNVHLMRTHAFQYFEEYLPPGTNEEKLEKVIQEGICEREIQDNDKVRYECSQCTVDLRLKSDVRYHILHKHFPQILVALSK